MDTHKAFITRSLLKDDEKAAPMEFEVALKMRNFAELSNRVATGEHISKEEIVKRYEPSGADYNTMAVWLVSKGMTITHRDSHHMAIFVRGKIAAIQDALGVSFARVSLEGKEYTSAVTAPGTVGAFLTLNDPVYNDNEAVAFRGTLKVSAGGGPTSTASGIWSSTGGSLALVARQAGQAPGCPTGATFSAFSELALPDQGGVIFLGT